MLCCCDFLFLAYFCVNYYLLSQNQIIMKKCMLFFLALGVMGFVFSQKNIVVTKPDGTSSKFFSKIDSALLGADPGDFVYIPGGSYNIGNLLIRKKLQIIGAGYHPDSSAGTGITFLSGSIYFLTGCDGASVTGFYLTGNMQFGTADSNRIVNNISISRCNFSSLNFTHNSGQPQNGNNFLITENIIRAPFYNMYEGTASNILITKNIIITGTTTATSIFNTTFKNNLFLGTAFYVSYSKNCIFENNIIMTNNGITGGYASSNFTFINNLYDSTKTYELPGAVVVNGNVGVRKDSVFVNVPDYSFSYKNNFQLTNYAKSIISGTDGKEVGIYGTNIPFKDGGMPYVPYIKTAEINPSTDPSGNLKIKFTVKAQQY